MKKKKEEKKKKKGRRKEKVLNEVNAGKMMIVESGEHIRASYIFYFCVCLKFCHHKIINKITCLPHYLVLFFF